MEDLIFEEVLARFAGFLIRIDAHPLAEPLEARLSIRLGENRVLGQTFPQLHSLRLRQSQLSLLQDKPQELQALGHVLMMAETAIETDHVGGAQFLMNWKAGRNSSNVEGASF